MEEAGCVGLESPLGLNKMLILVTVLPVPSFFLGDRSLPFTDQAFLYATQQPKLVPDYINKDT
jgi:hypothetical protein